MFPSTRELMDISDQHLLKNNPVQRADIKDAENIYGTNLGSLKGKMVTQKGITVAGQITGVPPVIKQKYQSMTLCIDLLFVNKIPFLLMILPHQKTTGLRQACSRRIRCLRPDSRGALQRHERPHTQCYLPRTIRE